MFIVYIKSVGYGLISDAIPVLKEDSTLDNLTDCSGNAIKCCPISKDIATLLMLDNNGYNLADIDENEQESYSTKFYIEW